jgi:hypothetical protein
MAASRNKALHTGQTGARGEDTLQAIANVGARPEGIPLGPSEDEIARAAYDRFQRRGGVHGSDIDDWLEAERELQQKHASGKLPQASTKSPAIGAAGSDIKRAVSDSLSVL